MHKSIVPLQFLPTLHYRIWGGNKLRDRFNKNTEENKIGESWEISTVPDYVSVVEKGVWAGENLNQLTEHFRNEPALFLGKEAQQKFGNDFPLLIKYIDADEPLSVQVHPDDVYAENHHQSKGKTEMWYIMEVEEGAEIIIGFQEGVTSALYKEKLAVGKVEDILRKVQPKVGDVYFIPAGRVHAIGKGITLAEVQQTSNITYRIYDYNRKDKDGKLRELHTEHAAEVSDFSFVHQVESPYVLKENEWVNMVDCPFFKTSVLYLKEEKTFHFNQTSFTIYMCVEGSATLQFDDHIYTLKTGESLLVPAGITEHQWIPLPSAKLLGVRV